MYDETIFSTLEYYNQDFDANFDASIVELINDIAHLMSDDQIPRIENVRKMINQVLSLTHGWPRIIFKCYAA